MENVVVSQQLLILVLTMQLALFYVKLMESLVNAKRMLLVDADVNQLSLMSAKQMIHVQLFVKSMEFKDIALKLEVVTLNLNVLANQIIHVLLIPLALLNAWLMEQLENAHKMH